MNKKVLSYIEKCESWKVAIKNLHWSSNSLSQHELCDDIASEISDFEDLVSEVEQSITGKIKLNGFTPDSYEITSLKKFVEDVISNSRSFLNELEGMGEEYVGIKSECETFIGTMQRKLYLVNFTLKEELKQRIKAKIEESYRKEENEKKFNKGIHTDSLTDNGMSKRITDIMKNSQFTKRPFQTVSDCIERCQRTFSKAGEFHVIGSYGNVIMTQLDAHNGYSYFGQIVISDSSEAGVVCTVSFNPSGVKNNIQEPDPEPESMPLEDENNYEIYGENKVTRMTENELKSMVIESVRNIMEDMYSYNGNDFRNDLENKYRAELEPEENYKQNIARFKEAFRRIAQEYPGKKSMKDFLSYVKEFEGETLYDKLWEKYGGEYDEVADQYLQKMVFSKRSGVKEEIEIKPSKKGTFTAAATKHGKSVQGFAKQVLNNKEDYSPAMVKKANFARNFGGKK